MDAKKLKARRHHLDKHVPRILAAVEGNADDLLKPRVIAQTLDVSEQWLELGRQKHYGPKYLKLSARTIRYRRGDVLAWLKSRQHRSTSEYEKSA